MRSVPAVRVFPCNAYVKRDLCKNAPYKTAVELERCLNGTLTTPRQHSFSQNKFSLRLGPEIFLLFSPRSFSLRLGRFAPLLLTSRPVDCPKNNARSSWPMQSAHLRSTTPRTPMAMSARASMSLRKGFELAKGARAYVSVFFIRAFLKRFCEHFFGRVPTQRFSLEESV